MRLVAEENEAHELDRRSRCFAHRGNGDRRRELDRIPVDTGRDRGKRNRPAAELRRDLQRPPVARGEQLGLVEASRRATPGRRCE